MTRECQVRICEGLGVKFPGPTRQKHALPRCNSNGRFTSINGPLQYASGEGHRGGGRAHANGLAQNARSGQLVYDQGIRQLQRLAAAGANSKAGDR